MKKELQEYYEARFSTFSQKGFLDLIEDAQNILKEVSNIDNSTTLEQLHFRKGQKDILLWLINLKEISERTYEDLKNESNV